jgi:hypothetical protein
MQFELPAMQVLNVRVGHSVALRSTKLAVALDVLNAANASADQALAPGGSQIFSTSFRRSTNRQFHARCSSPRGSRSERRSIPPRETPRNASVTSAGPKSRESAIRPIGT